jgi:hypothetical protein
MSRMRSKVDPWSGALLGLLLLIGSLAGVVHAARGAAAARQYFTAVYGRERPDSETIMDLCRKAYRWYPWNYRFSIVAAELAYRKSEAASTNAAMWRGLATLWCERGLAQNPYKSQLIRLKTRLLWPEAPAQAITCWSAYTDWNYWEPYNHAVLAELHAEAGDFERADRELDLIRSFPDYPDAAANVTRERRTRAEMLRGDEEGWGE